MKASGLRKKLRSFSVWYKLVRLWKAFQMTLFSGLVIFACCILIDRLVFLPIHLGVLALSLGALAMTALLIVFLTLARNHEVVSYLVDRKAGLKNLVSSGLDAEQHHSPVAQLIVARAHAALDQQDLRQTIPFRTNWAGKFSLIPLLCILGFLFLPQFDLLRREAEFKRKQAEANRREAGIQLIKEQVAEIQQHSRNSLLINGKDLSMDLKQLEQDLRLAETREDALAKLNSLENKYRRELDQQRNFEATARTLSLSPNKRDLDKTSAEELRKLAANLKQNRHLEAAENLQKLAQRMMSDELSELEKQALARELAKIMDAFTGNQDADELAELLKEMQKSQFAQDHDSNCQGSDCQDCKQFQQRLAKMQGGLDKMADTLRRMRSLQQMCEGLQGARDEMTDQEFSGFTASDNEDAAKRGLVARLGSNTGYGQGDGRGMGLRKDPAEALPDANFNDELSPSRVSRGRILNQRFVYGAPEGEAAQHEYSNEVRAAREQALHSLAQSKVPREYEERVKRYFSSLESQTADDGTKE